MTDYILLVDLGDESLEAEQLLEKIQLEHSILKADQFWKEINWPIPSLFVVGAGIAKGIEQIRELIEDFPNAKN